MRREHMIGLVLGVGVLVVAAAMYVSSPSEAPEAAMEESSTSIQAETIQKPVEPEEILVEEEDEVVSGGDVTRIIIEDADGIGEEIGGILSEKVIVDDQVVDKSELKKP